MIEMSVRSILAPALAAADHGLRVLKTMAGVDRNVIQAGDRSHGYQYTLRRGPHMKRLAWRPIGAVVGTLLLLSGCAALRNPMQVNVVDLQALQGEGLEMRMAVKLRVQNASDTAIAFHGIAIALDLRGNAFATGVSNTPGTVPPFGESLLIVPVSISALAAVRQALDIAADPTARFDYDLHGELATDGSGTAHFESRGQIALPPGLLSP